MGELDLRNGNACFRHPGIQLDLCFYSMGIVVRQLDESLGNGLLEHHNSTVIGLRVTLADPGYRSKEIFCNLGDLAVPFRVMRIACLHRLLSLRVYNLSKDAMRGTRQSVQDTILPVGQTRFHAIDKAKIFPLKGIHQVEKLMKEMSI